MIIGNAISPVNGFFSGGGFDVDAQAYINKGVAVGNIPLQEGINDFVVGYKDAGIWDRRKFIYLSFGGTAVLNSWNVRDLTKYQIIWFGSIVHDANGWQGNGSNGFGKTGYIPSLDGSLNDFGMSTYDRTVHNVIACDMGVVGSGGERTEVLSLNATNFIGNINTNSPNGGSGGRPNQLGLNSVNRFSSSEQFDYQDGLKLNNITSSSSTLPDNEIYIGARNDQGLADFFTTRQICFQALGGSLNEAEQLVEYNLVQALQTVANREI